MNSKEYLRHLEIRIIELKKALEKGVKHDVKHLVEHNLKINETLYESELRRCGKANVTSIGIQ